MMHKTLLLFIFTVLTLAAASRGEILQGYQNKEYRDVCIEGSKILRSYREDEPLINAVADACLKMHIVDLLPNPIVLLKKTPEARQNASFYATILFQKKMLYHALIDGIDISGVRVPKVDYVLSSVFDLFVRGKYTREGKVYLLDDGTYTYRMQVVETARHKKIELKQYRGNTFVQQYYYW